MNERRDVLLIDAGNTRIKWAFYRARDKTLETTQAHPYQNEDSLLQLKQQLADRVCERIYLCSVAAASITRRISAIAKAVGVPLCQLKNGHMALGLKQTAYQNPTQLGVDRCVLMIGARHIQPGGNLCVVGCGTALTLDVLDSEGRHLGGIISASPHAIRQKVVADAAGINKHIEFSDSDIKMDSIYTQTTEQALYNGSALSAIGLVTLVWEKISQNHLSDADSGAAWHLFYSGGGIAELLPYLPEQGVYYPELLMKGLAAIAEN